MWHLEFATDQPQTGVESIPKPARKIRCFRKIPLSDFSFKNADFWLNFCQFSSSRRDWPSLTEISWTCSCGVRFDAVRVDCQEFSIQLNSRFSYRFDQFLHASHFDQFHGPVWSWPRSDHMTCMQQMLICNRILSTSLKYFVKVTIEW